MKKRNTRGLSSQTIFFRPFFYSCFRRTCFNSYWNLYTYWAGKSPWIPMFIL